MAMPKNFASYKEKIQAKFTNTYLLIRALLIFISPEILYGFSDFFFFLAASGFEKVGSL